MSKEENNNQEENKALHINGVSNSSFNDEKFIEALFAEYNKSYKETKQGQHYPQWLNDEQLKWVLTVARNCCFDAIFEKRIMQINNTITILHIVALAITCSIGMYMTSNEIYFEQIYLIPFHLIMIIGIIILNNRMCSNYENQNKDDE